MLVDSNVPDLLYSPRHWAGAGGPAVPVGADGAPPGVRAAVPLVAGGPVSAAVGADRSLPAVARHFSVRTGGLGRPPPGVAVVPLLCITAALRALAASTSPGTGRKSGGGALPARATSA